MPRRGRGSRELGGAIDALRSLPTYARLVWALLRDPRVPAQQKLILAGIVGYLVLPLDLIPDFIPVIGQLDDLAVVLLGIDLFLKVAPRAVVAEHMARIARDEDDLRHDLAQVEDLLGDRFTDIRATLLRRIARGKKGEIEDG